LLNDEQDGVQIVTVPACLGQTYAAWVPGMSVIVVAADTWEEQLAAIMGLVHKMLERSAARDRRPAVRSD
jgi:hypothetical protein